MTTVGFTGTQEGMTVNQHTTLLAILLSNIPEQAHHGDCVGSDEEFHAILRESFPETQIIGHPPSNPTKRAWCHFDLKWEPKPYLERNHDIVDCSTFVIATPKEFKEELRSGTWATIRYARKTDTPVFIIYPDGNMRP